MVSSSSPRPSDATVFTLRPTCALAAPSFASFRDGALFWHGFGLDVIPIRPGSKATAVPWDPWVARLSPGSIKSHWRQHPDHEVGFIVGDRIIVFDADSPEALSALHAAEVRCGIEPLLVVGTRRGEHHYYRRDADISAAPSLRDLPPKLDVKTGRAMVVLPPSTGKTIIKLGASK